MIQAFLTRFPQFRKNELYITSESYGGHYLPTLAKQIVDENTAAATTGNPVINFKGFALGNPATTFYSAILAVSHPLDLLHFQDTGAAFQRCCCRGRASFIQGNGRLQKELLELLQTHSPPPQPNAASAHKTECGELDKVLLMDLPLILPPLLPLLVRIHCSGDKATLDLLILLSALRSLSQVCQLVRMVVTLSHLCTTLQYH